MAELETTIANPWLAARPGFSFRPPFPPEASTRFDRLLGVLSEEDRCYMENLLGDRFFKPAASNNNIFSWRLADEDDRKVHLHLITPEIAFVPLHAHDGMTSA
jgi:hypothetical protein